MLHRFKIWYCLHFSSRLIRIFLGLKHEKLCLKFNIRNVKLIRKIVHGIHHIDIDRSIYSDKNPLSNACDVMCTHMFFIRGRRCYIGPCASVYYFTLN